jgi:hypothetical protein
MSAAASRGRSRRRGWSALSWPCLPTADSSRRRETTIYPLEGGSPRPLPGADVGERPIVWSADGGSIYVYQRREPTARVFKIDVATGTRELWKTIAPADRAGLIGIDNIAMTSDASGYACSYEQILTSLKLAEGLR